MNEDIFIRERWDCLLNIRVELHHGSSSQMEGCPECADNVVVVAILIFGQEIDESSQENGY